MTYPHHLTKTCRACGSDRLEKVFSLGSQHVSDFVTENDVSTGEKYPITILWCPECSLAQEECVAPLPKRYWYKSGVTSTMRVELHEIAAAAQRYAPLKPGNVVLDIGSNDGTLLRQFPEGVVKVGCEPMEFEGMDEGVDVTIRKPWSLDAYIDRAFAERNKAKIVTALGMFYSVSDPDAFIRDVTRVLHPEGVFVLQMMCLKQMLAAKDIGNLCHEHLTFWTLQSLGRLLFKHGLEIFELEENSTNGGSYRFYIKPINRPPVKVERGARANYYRETLWENNPTGWTKGGGHPINWRAHKLQEFYSDALTQRSKLLFLLRKIREEGKRVWVYGASTKGNCMLQWWDVDNQLIEAAAERSQEKWGLFTKGTGIRIEPELRLRLEADYALVLPYAFLAEMMERESEWINGGGKFIVPIPEVRIVP